MLLPFFFQCIASYKLTFMKHCFFSMTYHYESFYSFSKCYSLNVVIKNVPVINVLINNMRFKVNCLHRNVLSLLCSLKNLCTSDLLFLSSLFCTKLVLYITILAPFYCLSSLGSVSYTHLDVYKRQGK